MICKKATLFERPDPTSQRFLKYTNERNSWSKEKTNCHLKCKIDKAINPVLFIEKLKRKKAIFVDRIPLIVFQKKGFLDFKNHWSTHNEKDILISDFPNIINSVSGLTGIFEFIVSHFKDKKVLIKIICIPIELTYPLDINSEQYYIAVNMSGQVTFPTKNVTLTNSIVFIFVS